jgi:hypothetical protein
MINVGAEVIFATTEKPAQHEQMQKGEQASLWF